MNILCNFCLINFFHFSPFVTSVWGLPEEVYLATLNDQDTSRVMTLDCTTTEMGDLRIVTGGQEVKVWDRLSKNRYR